MEPLAPSAAPPVPTTAEDVDPELSDEDPEGDDPLNVDGESGDGNIDQPASDEPEEAWKYTPTKFWNYVDDELVNVRSFVQKTALPGDQDAKLTE